jgi:hypothetical protein
MNGFVTRTMPARLCVLLVCALVAGFAVSCGGNGDEKAEPSPTPTAAGLELPSDLSDEQKAAVISIPDPGDSTKQLATLVSSRTLNADEAQEAVASDPQFTALQGRAEGLGFGEPSSGMELRYDNGVTVTAAVLGEPGDPLALALRSSEPKLHYLIVELDQATKKLTAYDSQGTVTIDLETGTVEAAESPEAHHSCSFLQCFHTSILVLMDIPIYGELVETTCSGCLELILTGVAAPLATPVCATCAVTATAGLLASAWLCDDDPCSYCMDNTCGDPPMSHDEFCATGVGSVASVMGANTGYHCAGIKENLLGGSDYSETECQYSSESTGIVRACPYGCAEVAPGDTESRDCASLSTCDPATCNSEVETGDPHCVSVAPPGKDVLKRDYEVWGCVDTLYGGSICQSKTEARQFAECDYGCADSLHCAQPTPTATLQSSGCDPATCGEKPVGDPECKPDPVGHAGRVTQDYQHCACQPVQGEPGQSSCECGGPVTSKVKEVCPAGCADNKSCAVPTVSPGRH